jgi:hypothetical protein
MFAVYLLVYVAAGKCVFVKIHPLWLVKLNVIVYRRALNSDGYSDL